MRILHIENTAGVGSDLAQAQIELGHDARVLETWKSYMNWPHDYTRIYQGTMMDKIAMMWKSAIDFQDFDIYHIHSGINWKRLDIVLLKLMHQKPFVIHYHGSEVTKGYNKAYTRFADAKIVATPNLLKWHKDAIFIPNPMVAREDLSWQIHDPVRIVHLPTRPQDKGTSVIRDAIEELGEMGINFEFEEEASSPERSHDQVLEIIRTSDIIIDQVNDLGVFGRTSMEAMSFGKVAIASYNRKYDAYYPDVQIMMCKNDPGDLCHILKGLVNCPTLIQWKGQRGFNYVQEKLNPLNITKKVMLVYQKVLHAAK